MRSFKAMLMGSAAVACIGVASQPAHAAGYGFGAGGTAAQVVYRQLMDCLYEQAQGNPGGSGANSKPFPLAAACPSADSGDGSGFGEILYAGTGSGNGKATFLSNSVTTIGAPSNSIPWTDSTIGVTAVTQYDGVQFAGSDVPVNLSDVTTYQTAVNATTHVTDQAGFGNMIEMPAMVIPITIFFNGTDGNNAPLNINNPVPTNGTSGLNLSRQAMCGIWSGHITQWSNPILTALNGGVPLGSGNITFVHRTDASGSTFLIANAMQTQCVGTSGPTSESSPTVTSYEQPWTDRNPTTDCAVPPAGLPWLNGAPTDWLNFPDFTTDRCGNAIANPGGGHFANASGSGNLVTAVQGANGSIGYVSADYVAPIKTGGLKTANLQAKWDVAHGNTNVFTPPTAAGAANAFGSPNGPGPFFGSTGSSITDPLAWTLQGVNGDPSYQGSYPISGFTWILMYQCYQPHSNGNNAYAAVREFVDYMYGATPAHNIIQANGFALVPTPWQAAVYTLIAANNGATGPALVGSTAACSAGVVVGAH